MCGDDDDLNQVDEQLYNQFLKLAARHGVRPDDSAQHTPVDLSSESSRASYMEGLFRAGMTRAVNDAAHLKAGERMDVVAGQAIVFARLAGVLAGQFPPESDLFHAVISALMEGHKEPGKHH